MSEIARYDVVSIDDVIAFKVTHAVFPAGKDIDICYCTSEERAIWVARQLNRGESVVIAGVRSELQRSEARYEKAKCRIEELEEQVHDLRGDLDVESKDAMKWRDILRDGFKFTEGVPGPERVAYYWCAPDGPPPCGWSVRDGNLEKSQKRIADLETEIADLRSHHHDAELAFQRCTELEETNREKADERLAFSALHAYDLQSHIAKLKEKDKRIADLEKVEHCEQCGSDRIYHGPPDCPYCGAPNCCQVCCKTTRLEKALASVEAKQKAKEKVTA